MNKSEHGTVNTLHWLYHACVWYVLDTCWNNIFNRKQCFTGVHGQVKMKKCTTRPLDFATPAGHVLLSLILA